ncbi:hypothetical protein JCM21738_510 [Mesobacillus boroniphilus JCM 21738]|uniref:Uncharacterized protein n=1 Tax=Mesobacillus boroniphilus JCM 21738 TaxID=1294265 RepID=W4RHS9_9BACI|nr:hypothetical protein JCM21738_510 [Mesobacillus boroniphilus JCM 21738]
MTYIAPFAYVIQPDGSLILYMKDDTEAIQTGLAKGALPMMSITNLQRLRLGRISPMKYLPVKQIVTHCSTISLLSCVKKVTVA